MRKHIHTLRIMFLAALTMQSGAHGYRASAQTQPRTEDSTAARRDLPQLTLQLGHSGRVNAVAFSSDGQFILTGSAQGGTDDSVILWATATGREIRRFHFANGAKSIVFLPGGYLFLTEDYEEGNTILWNAETGKVIHDFEDDSPKFSPDGRLLLTSNAEEVIAWVAATGERFKKFRAPKSVSEVSFSPDGHHVVIETSDRQIVLWDLEKDKEDGRFSGSHAKLTSNGQLVAATLGQETVLWNAATHQEIRRFPGTAVDISKDGRFLITDDAKQTALWDLKGNRLLRRFAGDLAQISPDKRLVVTRDSNEPVIWNALTGKELHRFHHDVDGVTDLRFSTDGRFFLTEGSENKGTMPQVWDAITINEIRELPSFDSTSAIFSPDNRLVLTGAQDKIARLWDTATGLEVRRFEGLAATTSWIDFPAEGRFLQINSIHQSGGIVDSIAAHLWNMSSGQEVRHFEGVPDTANSAAISPDGRRAATGGGTTVHLWNIADGNEIRSFTGHTDRIVSVRFSPNGRLLATASQDGTARLWEISSGKQLQTLIGHREGLSAVRFSHDGRFVLTGSADGTARLWSVVTGKELRRYGEHAAGVISSISSVAFSSDDRYVLAGCNGTNDLSKDSELELVYSARLWNMSTGAEVKDFKHDEAVMSVAFSPDGGSILTASGDATARVWNIRTGETTRILKKDFDVGIFADYSPDGRFILTGGLELDNPSGSAVGSRASLWNAATGQEVRNFASGSANDLIPFFATLNAEFSADGRFMITQGNKHQPSDNDEVETESDSLPTTGSFSQPLAQVWEVATGKEIARFGRSSGDPEVIKFSADANSVLMSRQERSALDILDAFTGKITNVMTDSANTITDVTYSPDGRFIAGASQEGATYLWDALTRKLIHRFQDKASSGWNASITSVAYLPGGLHGAIFVDGRIYLSEISSGNSFDMFEFLGSPQGKSFGLNPSVKATCAALSRKEELISVGDPDGTVHLVRYGQRAEGKLLKGHSGAITALTFSPNGRVLASASDDKTVRLWDVSTGKQVHLLQHLDSVSAIAFSDDDHFVLTVSGGSAWLWNADSGNQIRQLKDPSGVSASSFLGTSGRMVTGAEDGTLRMWDGATGVALQTFKGHLGRINSIAITPNNKFIVSGSADKTARLWDVTKPVEVRRFEGHTEGVTTIAISADGNDLLTGSADQTVRVWDLEKGTEKRRIEKRLSSDVSVAFSPDGHYLLVGSISVNRPSADREPSFAGVARLWDLRTMDVVRSFGSVPVVYAAFSLDGKFILTAGGALSAGGLSGIGGVAIWEVATGKLVKELEFEGYVRSVAISPDGQSILTGTPFVDPQEDPTVATAYSQSNEALLTRMDQEADEGKKFVGHTFPVNKVAFSPDSRFIVTGSLDGTSAFWDLATQKQICRLISLRDGNWVVVDEEGRFDTNNLEEIKGLQWVFSGDPMTPLPLEIYMRDYYEPRLLPSLLSRKPLPPIRPLGSLNRLQPIVKITRIEPRKINPESDIMVTVEVANASSEQLRDGKPVQLQSGVFDLRLFRDGQLVGYLPGSVKLDQNGRATVPFPVKLRRDRANEKVEFTAYAFNVDRVKSAAASYTYQPRAPRRPIKGRAYVISVGVNGYEDQSLDLSFAANDAQLSQQVLSEKLSATGLYREVIPITLISDNHKAADGGTGTDRLAMKQNFRAVLDILAHGLTRAGQDVIRQIPGAGKLRKVEPEDLVLISFSSHGYTDRQGKFYLIPYDTGSTVQYVPGGDIAPSSLSHFISSDELREWFREIDAGELVMIVDTCHSAATVESEGFKPGPMGSRGMGQLAYDKGMRILAASQADDVALELDRLQHGLLTYALMEEGLNQKQADKNSDGKITLDEWLSYGAERVPALYDDVKLGRLEDLKRRDVRISSMLSGASVKKSAFQQPQLFDFKRKRREIRLQ